MERRTIVELAIAGINHERDRLAAIAKELYAELNRDEPAPKRRGRPPKVVETVATNGIAPKKRKPLSAATRRKMSIAQRARYRAAKKNAA